MSRIANDKKIQDKFKINDQDQEQALTTPVPESRIIL